MTVSRASLKLQLAKSELLARVNTICNNKMGAIKNGYPEEEIKTWDQQIREALLHQSDPGASVPMVAAIAARRGLTTSETTARILNKASLYAAGAGSIIGRRQELADVIDACTNRQELNAIAAVIESGWPV